MRNSEASAARRSRAPPSEHQVTGAGPGLGPRCRRPPPPSWVTSRCRPATSSVSRRSRKWTRKRCARASAASSSSLGASSAATGASCRSSPATPSWPWRDPGRKTGQPRAGCPRRPELVSAVAACGSENGTDLAARLSGEESPVIGDRVTALRIHSASPGCSHSGEATLPPPRLASTTPAPARARECRARPRCGRGGPTGISVTRPGRARPTRPGRSGWHCEEAWWAGSCRLPVGMAFETARPAPMLARA